MGESDVGRIGREGCNVVLLRGAGEKGTFHLRKLRSSAHPVGRGESRRGCGAMGVIRGRAESRVAPGRGGGR